MPKDIDAIMASADPEQRRLMAECCILIDENDVAIGHETKKNCHLNTNIYGAANLLHRAFSVFIFDDQYRVLMQQRSDDKITFPAYWANTCCSHPLYVPDELEQTEEDIAAGAKTAAIRKLEQELGITPDQVPRDCFHFLSRVHYKAKSDEIWGEHEIDYILFCFPPAPLRFTPNRNEVQATRWFSQDELRNWVHDSSHSDLISPWFRAIEDFRLHRWWSAAAARDDATLFADRDTIYRVKPSGALACDDISAPAASPTRSGSLRRRRPADKAERGQAPVDSVAAARKQGAYGRVRTHSHSLLETLVRPNELLAALRYKLGGGLGGGPVCAPANASGDLKAAFAYCDSSLSEVSRSFAAVIRQLDPEMRRAICVFYLVLRALDTVEDDTAVPHDRKRSALKAFWQGLEEPSFSVKGVGEAHERDLLERFPLVSAAYRALPKDARQVIREITRLMGHGMAEFVGSDLREGTETVAAYNRYCHYVAGLVGEGLSRLFALDGAEDASLATDLARSNHMGLFLQKTNILRDYLEDWVDGRAFWPRAVWSRYAERLGDLRLPEHRQAALACMDELVADALAHAPHSLAYLARLNNERVFRFCAIPQLMAVATLAECLREPRVFTGVIKIRKSLAVRMIAETASLADVHRWFAHFAEVIADKASEVNSAATRMRLAHAAADILRACNRSDDADAVVSAAVAGSAPRRTQGTTLAFAFGSAVSVALLVATGVHVLSRFGADTGTPFGITTSSDVLACFLGAFALTFIISFCGVPATSALSASARRGSVELADKATVDAAHAPLGLGDVDTSEVVAIDRGGAPLASVPLSDVNWKALRE